MITSAVTFEVAQRFHSLRHRYLFVRLAAGLVVALAALALSWLALALCDLLWEWQLAVRRVLFVGACATVLVGLGYYGTQTVIDSRQRRFASVLENRFATFGQRLRTVLENVEGRLRAPEAMLAALGNQTLARWETESPTQILPTRFAVIVGLLGFCISAASLGGLIFENDWRVALLRAAGQDRPYAISTVLPGNVKLLEGSALTLSMELQGRPQHSVILRHRNASDATWLESELLPETAKESSNNKAHSGQPGSDQVDSRRTLFAASFGKLTRQIEYQFISAGRPTEIYRVDVQPLIVAERVSTSVIPPAYTRLDKREFVGPEVTVLAGSQVQVVISTKHPLHEAVLEIGEKANQLQAAQVSSGATQAQWMFSLPTDRSSHWRFSGKGTDGTPMVPVAGRLRVRHDATPRIEWREPVDNIRAHMLAELPMQVQVADDYGLTQAAIVIQLGDEEPVELTLWNADEELPENSPSASTQESKLAVVPRTQVRLDEILPLESFTLTEQDFVSYYAYAVDNRDGAPQRVESDVRYIDIRPLRQYWTEREAGIGFGGSGSGLPELDEIIRRQRYIVNRTRKFERAGEDENRQLISLERVTASQSELADLTRFLAEFLAARGNDSSEALSQAEVAMLQASDSLSVASYTSALQREEDALRSLAEARNTIERSITTRFNMTAVDFQQLRRQLRQRMRGAPTENDRQLADTLLAIALDQKTLAEDTERTLAEPNIADKPNTVDAKSPDKSPESTAAETSDDAKKNEQEDNTKEEFQSRQQGLVDRLQEIDDTLSADVKQSKLVDQRMRDGLKEMDELIGEFRTDNLADVPRVARELSDDLIELAEHVKSLTEQEPSNRIAAVRDLATSMANLESEQSRISHTLADVAKTIVRPNQRDTNTQDSVRENDNASNALDSTPRAQSKNSQARLQRISRRLKGRADTMEDVLAKPPALGNLEASEIHDRLQELVKKIELARELAATRAASNQPLDEKLVKEYATAAEQRARQYADTATQLDNFYRQLVTPRVDQLRQLESKANELAQLLMEQSDDSQQKTQPKTASGTEPPVEPTQDGNSRQTSGDIARKVRELELALRSAGLDAEADKLDAQFQPNTSSIAGSVIDVQKELRRRIQELILMEIAVDRNSPVPPQYIDLVDRYFRSLAEGTGP